MSVELGDGIEFTGRCSSNGAWTPKYNFILRNSAGIEYAVNTNVEGGNYTAKSDAPCGKYEVLVHFHSFPVISTGTYLNGKKVEFVAGEFAEPDGAVGILKAYSQEYDTYIYQDGDRLVWYIGYDIEPATEIIYHIYTNDGSLLPSDRIQYGFDNRGFRPTGNNELAGVDGYRVFEKEIPTEYPITSITVGFNPGSGVTWSKSFRLSE